MKTLKSEIKAIEKSKTNLWKDKRTDNGVEARELIISVYSLLVEELNQYMKGIY